MYGIISLFTILFLSKSIILNEFYSNHLIFSIFPLELAALSLYNSKLSITSYTRWALIGWLGLENEHKVLNDIEEIEENDYVIIFSWFISYILFQLYYVINEYCINKRELNKWTLYSYNLKYYMINYVSLYMWNFNKLINMEDSSFWFVLIHLLILNTIAFWYPGILFNFIYGEKMYIYRIKFKFLIDDFHLKYKYSMLVLLFLKIITGIYIILFNYWIVASRYSLLIILCLFTLLCYFNNILKYKKLKYNIIYLSILASSIIILSIIEYYLDDYLDTMYILNIAKIFLFIIYILVVIKYIRQEKKRRSNIMESRLDDEIIEMEELNL